MRGSDERIRVAVFSTWILRRGFGGIIRCGRSGRSRTRRLTDRTRIFAALYPRRLGRPSIAPERLLRAMLLQAFYGIRSERQLMERMEFDLLFRWFVGLGVDDPAWDHSSFTQEPRPAAGGRDRGEVPARGAGPAEGEAAAVERPLLGGWHADRGLGLDQELPPQGRRRQRPRRARAATPSATSTRRSAPTRPTRARPIRRRGSTRRATASRPSSATWAMP